MKIIYDCDTGMDDAISIATITAIKDFDIMGICCVAGNVELDKVINNTLGVLEYLQKDINVYAGENKPLERELKVAYDFHGESGIGDIILPNPKSFVQNKSAVDFMYETIMDNRGELEIVATGPLTNVAKLLLTYPDVKGFIKGITFMGGAIKRGNVTPHAEFNVYCDPEASKIVIDSGVQVTMVGLDATMRSKLYTNDMKFLENSKKLSGKLIDIFYKGMLNTRKSLGMDFAVLHDSITTLSLIKPEMFRFENLKIDIDLAADRRGKTYISDNANNVKVATNFNKDMFIDYMKQIF